MIEIITRPIGAIYSPTNDNATVTNSSGEALFTSPAPHGLTDGLYVRIFSDVDIYQGFKKVDVISATTFKIINGEGTEIIEFIKEDSVIYNVAVSPNRWVCAHLPIVYEITSDIYPTNTRDESYPPNVVGASANSNGYTQITTQLDLLDPVALTWISIGDNIYQIISVVTNSQVVINLAYDVDNDLSGTVLKYYNNYCVNIEVWCGYDADHRWYAYKPIELASTLQVIPDADNFLKVSINEIVKSYINTRNNLSLGTLPNNTDFTTEFYIRAYESYDSSDGTTITTTVGTIIDDQTFGLGVGVNSILPFKSLQINSMSDYLSISGVILAKWLVLQARPLLIVGKFFDISFINSLAGVDISVNINKMLNDLVVQTEVLTFTDPGIGILRVEITAEDGFDTYCIYAYTPGRAAIGPVATSLQALASWSNRGATSYWTPGAAPSVTVDAGTSGTSGAGYLSGTMPTTSGQTYSMSMQLTVSGPSAVFSATVTWYMLDASLNIVSAQSFAYTTDGAKSETFDMIPSADGAYFAIRIENGSMLSSKTYTINSAVYNSSPTIPGIAAQVITETICMDVIGECDNSLFPDDIRLLEDGDFRILE
jgi:hypothetical protein